MMNRTVALLGLGILFHLISLSGPPSARADTPQWANIDAPHGGQVERVYFYSASGDVEKLVSLRKHLISRGAHHVNGFLPFTVVCELPATLSIDDYLAGSDIVAMREETVGSGMSRGFVGSPEWVKQCYKAAGIIPVEEPSEQQAPPAFDAYRMPPMDPIRRPVRQMPISSSQQEQERNYDQNTEYLLGDILVQVVYPESQGPAENWTDGALASAASGVTLALLYFQESYSYASIDFLVRSIPRATTAMEPINYTRDNQHVWITDVMNNLGYPGDRTEYLDLVHQFNDEWRIKWRTDWVFTAFIVNSANNIPYHAFPYTRNNKYGFGRLGGPYMVVPFPTGILGTLLFRPVFRHEMAYVFWAQYESVSSSDDCYDRSGYLNEKNWNRTKSYGAMGAAEGCSKSHSPDPCLMNIKDVTEYLYEGSPCEYTTRMLGLSDDNRNGVPDAVDAPPIIEFDPAGTETLFVDNLSLRFQAISIGVPNQNSRQSAATRISHALPIKDISYMVNNVGPIRLLPEDGVSDEATEDFTATLTSLMPGLTKVEVYARNTMGATSQWFTKYLYYLGLSYKHFQFDFSNEGIGISWNMMGETFDAQFDLHRIEPDPQETDNIVISDVQPSAAPNGYFLPFNCIDTDVVPGRKYRYYVEGAFPVEYRGEVITITKRSNEFEVYAALQMTEGSILSAPSPNPFREQTWISIDIPNSYREAGTEGTSLNKNPGASRAQFVEESIPTWVKVTIFNVLGQRVKNLYHDRIYSTVITIPWDGTNNNNQRVPSGVYFIQAESGPYTQVQKITVIR